MNDVQKTLTCSGCLDEAIVDLDQMDDQLQEIGWTYENDRATCQECKNACTVCGDTDVCCGDNQEAFCKVHCHHEKRPGVIGINGLERGE